MAKEVICEAQCPACDEMVKFYKIGVVICPYCKGTKAEFTVDWEIIEDEKDE